MKNLFNTDFSFKVPDLFTIDFKVLIPILKNLQIKQDFCRFGF